MLGTHGRVMSTVFKTQLNVNLYLFCTLYYIFILFSYIII